MPILAFGSRARSYTRTICFDTHEDLATWSQVIGRGIPPVARYVFLTKREQMYRALFLVLQLGAGLETGPFEERFGEDPLKVFAPLIAALRDRGCVRQEAGSVRLTDYGACFVEDVSDFVMDALLREESDQLARSPHSLGSTSSRLTPLV